MKPLFISAVCGLGLWAGSAAAHGYGHGDYLEDKYDRQGDRIERRLDRQGDRIERELDHEADRLRRQGHYAEARRLEREGDRIDRKLDKKGRQINRQLDRRGEQRHHYAQRPPHGRHHGHHHGHHQPRRPAYVYEPRPWRSHEPQVALVLDLGQWVIRP
jgi:hypothetical protein